MKKRIFSIILTLCTLFTFFPLTSFAGGVTSAQDEILITDGGVEEVATVTLNAPTYGSGNQSVFSFDNATITNIEKIYSLTIKLDNYTNVLSKPEVPAVSNELKNIAGDTNTITYQFEDGITKEKAQSFFRELKFRYGGLKASSTTNVSVTIDGNSTNLPQGASITEYNGHYYMYVHEYLSWTDAYVKAKSYTYMGLKGYLVTITSAEEDKVLDNITTNGAWSGGTLYTGTYDSDTAPNGAVNQYFKWVCGPEAGTNYYYLDSLRDVYPVNGAYDGFFASGEPNAMYVPEYGKSECCMQVHYKSSALSKTWNDLLDIAYDGSSAVAEISVGYFVEFSDYSGGRVGNYVANAIGNSSVPISVTKGDVFNTVKDGGTYYADTVLTAFDRNITGIKVNNAPVSSGYTLLGNQNTTYSIEATDLGGNIATTIVTMKTIASISEPIQSLTVNNVQMSDRPGILAAKATLKSIDQTTASAAQKAEIANAIQNCNNLYFALFNATCTAVNGTNGWYKNGISDITLTAPDGFEISTSSSGAWTSAITIDKEEGNNKTATYYLKETATEEISSEKIFTYKVDTQAPTGKISIENNHFTSLINSITFGVFLKNPVNVTISGADTLSIPVTISYQKVEVGENYSENGTWTNGSSFDVTDNKKFAVYAKIEDNAGNTTIINSEGVVVYTDSTQNTADIKFIKTSTTDITADVNLNGNTVKEIKNGNSVIANTNYTVSNDGKITFKASYLDTLAVGNYTLTISYNPMGENFVTDRPDQNQTPATTTIQVTVNAAGIVGTPTFAPVAGTYTENQSVALTSSTEGATIYYTTNGTTPTTDSDVYSGAISVTGIAGQSKSTTIKAIAVKAGMQTSSVASATYVIEIPVPAPSTYAVTVNNGTGDGNYVEGATVIITADVAPSGQVFDKWTVVSGGVTLASANSATTTFKMPANAVEVTAITTKKAPSEAPKNSAGVAEKADTSIIINTVSGNEYQLRDPDDATVSDVWITDKDGDGKITFDDLTPNTEYTLAERVAETDTTMPSKELTTTVSTKKAPSDAPAGSVDVTENTDTKIVINTVSGNEYQLRDPQDSSKLTEWIKAGAGNETITFSGLTAGKDYTLVERTAETDTAMPSQEKETTVSTKQAISDAPASATGVAGKTDTSIVISAEPGREYQIRIPGSENVSDVWITDKDGDGKITFDNLIPGKDYILVERVAETDTAMPSQEKETTVSTKQTATNPPSVNPDISSKANVSDTSITIAAEQDKEYRLLDVAGNTVIANWITDEDKDGKITFSGLTANTKYYLVVRVKETDTAMPSHPSTGIEISTKPETGPASEEYNEPATPTSTKTEKEKQEIADKLGVSAETAAKIQQVAQQYDVEAETLYVTTQSIKNQKNDSDIAGSTYIRLKAKIAKKTKNSIQMKWNKVKGVDGYIIYGNLCGKNNKYQEIATIKNNKTTTYTNKKLKKGRSYKYIVRAYKMIDGNQVTLAASKTLHIATDGSKYTTASTVKVNKTSVSLKKGKTFKIKASEVKKDKKKKIAVHVKVRYESTNEKVVTVSKTGVIKAQGKGTCYIVVYAQNGVSKGIKVTVK